jgi:Mg2+/citrate symporter
MYLLAILLPPLAILLSGRPFQAIFNAVLWLAGLVLMILPFVPGLLTWAIAAVWAVMVVNSEKQAERDRRLVETALERDRSRRVR